MKITTNNYINARPIPGTEQLAPYYRPPAYTLDVDKIEIGLEINGNSIWYHCTGDGMYYWSGGIAPTIDELGQKFTNVELVSIYKSLAGEISLLYRYQPGYSGTAAGFAADGQVSMYVYFDTNENLQQAQVSAVMKLRGVELQIKATAVGKTRLCSIGADMDIPYVMGGSISENTDMTTRDISSFGTRTLLVTYNSKTYLLTCFHVACNSLMENKKHHLDLKKRTVIYPSPMVSEDQETYTGTVIEGHFTADYDYALVEVDESKLNNCAVRWLFHGMYTLGEIRSDLLANKPIKLYGAKSEQKSANFKTFHTDSIVVDTDANLSMTGLIEAELMSQKGDSGAAVVDENNKLIGYVIADNNNNTYILPFDCLTSKGIKPKF